MMVSSCGFFFRSVLHIFRPMIFFSSIFFYSGYISFDRGPKLLIRVPKILFFGTRFLTHAFLWLAFFDPRGLSGALVAHILGRVASRVSTFALRVIVLFTSKSSRQLSYSHRKPTGGCHIFSQNLWLIEHTANCSLITFSPHVGHTRVPHWCEIKGFPIMLFTMNFDRLLTDSHRISTGDWIIHIKKR